MKLFRKVICGSVFGVLLGILPTPTLADISPEYRAWIKTLTGVVGSREKIKQHAMALFRQNDLDSVSGVSSNDRTLLIARQTAAIRSRAIAKWIVSDLNGDLALTVDELRATAIPKAYKPLRSGSKLAMPTRDQAEEFIRVEIEQKMKIDINGDLVISFEEILDSVAVALNGRSHIEPQVRMMPSLETDLDKDGVVSDVEMEIAIDAMITLMDIDNDGKVSVMERQQMQKELRDPKPSSAHNALLGLLTKRPKCVLPQPEKKELVAVVGGYEGSGLSDIHFGNTADTVKVIDYIIPSGGAPIYLIVTVQDSVIIRVTDKSQRLKKVVMTGGEVALVGDGNVKPQRVHSDCNLQMWNRQSRDNPDPLKFYGERLGRSPDRLVSAYTLGTININGGNNAATTQLPDALSAPTNSKAAEAWKRFEMFNPGGLISIDPKAVRSLQPVFKHDPLPQFAGISQLLENGTLLRLQGGLARRQVTESENGEIRLGKKIFRPGGGDNAILFEGLRYTEERPKIWVGREKEVYLATRAFTFPAGLAGAHSITVLIPEGMEVPRGSPGTSVIRRLTQSAIVPAEEP